MRTSPLLSALFSGAAILGTTWAAAAPRPMSPAPDFNREVRPILARHCFKCHGPDDKQRQAGLRLDVPEAAVAVRRPGVRALHPGFPQKSEAIRRIALRGKPGQMPPASAQLDLTAAQAEVLKRWVQAGARYEKHWSFVAPTLPRTPVVRSRAWVRTPIDSFVLARLEREGLPPSREADRETLVRRLYLDLVGLPPTPEEAQQFVDDTSPTAYEALVDRLLAAPSYGERWARKWLDLARYADTNGYEKDRPRSIWPFRDWVIQAFNADMPFDEFSIRQLAGDMLPNADATARVATGFHRNTMLNEEGGIDPLEFRFHSMVDRMQVTGATWLGLTVQCAQCHTHKYDPIQQREYYALMAFLNNADEPEFEVPDPSRDARSAEVGRQVAERERALAALYPAGDGLSSAARLERDFVAWIAEQRKRVIPWTRLVPSDARSNLPLLEIDRDGVVTSSGDQSKRDLYEITLRTLPQGTQAIRIDAITDENLPRRGPGRIYYEGPFGDFFLSEVSALQDGAPIKIRAASNSFAAGASNAAAAIDGNPQTGWSINGGQGKPHHAVFVLEMPFNGRELTFQLLFEKYFAAGMGRFRLSASPLASAAAVDLEPEIEAYLLRPEGEWTPSDRQALKRAFLLKTPLLATARAEVDKLRASLPAPITTLVMQERPAGNPRPTHLHHRGEFLQPREKVQPAIPAFLPPLPTSSRKDRLAFARWLVSPGNPMVGRVTVNRHWAAFFGRGLVRTTEDFGIQGEQPSHPELLDWLAVRFTSTGPDGLGWSIKKLHRLIVTSATYRQQSSASPELQKRDAQNVLLARGPRHRLEAELIRDSLLKVSGLLSPKIGGPSVFPPQPAGVTSEGTYGPLNWQVSTGEDRYRRGLYTFAKRTAPYAMFATFDGPSGEACVARRESSNTALQALTLLNDGVVLEAAQALGRLVSGQGVDDGARVEWLYRRCLTRGPSPTEKSAMLAFVARQRSRLSGGELDASKICGAAEPTADRAVWTLAARVVLNLDEAITKR